MFDFFKKSWRTVLAALVVALVANMGILAVAQPGLLRVLMVRAGLAESRKIGTAKLEDGGLGGYLEFPPQLVTGEEPLVCTFDVQNPFSEEVTFLQVTPSCTCTEAKLREKTVPAKGATVLTASVRLSTLNVEPKRFEVVLTDQSDRKWKYVFTTKSYPVLRIDQPPSRVNLGDFPPGPPWKAKFSAFAYRPENSPKHSVTARPASDEVSAVVHELKETVLEIGIVEQEFEVEITGRQDRDGIGSARLALEATNGKLAHKFDADLSWKVTGPFTADPATIRFGYSPDEQIAKQSMQIRRQDGRRFRITKVESALDAVQFEVRSLDELTHVNIDATLDRAKITRAFYEKVQIHTSDSSFPVFSVWMSGLPLANLNRPTSTDSTERKSEP